MAFVDPGWLLVSTAGVQQNFTLRITNLVDAVNIDRIWRVGFSLHRMVGDGGGGVALADDAVFAGSVVSGLVGSSAANPTRARLSRGDATDATLPVVFDGDGSPWPSSATNAVYVMRATLEPLADEEGWVQRRFATALTFVMIQNPPPTALPTVSPTTSAPSSMPSRGPTSSPSTSSPTPLYTCSTYDGGYCDNEFYIGMEGAYYDACTTALLVTGDAGSHAQPWCISTDQETQAEVPRPCACS